MIKLTQYCGGLFGVSDNNRAGPYLLLYAFCIITLLLLSSCTKDDEGDMDSLQNNYVEQYDFIDNAEYWLQGVTSHSDMTWVGDNLVGFDPQPGELQDPSQESAARIHVYSFPNGINGTAVDKILYHQFGHCNTVDYCEDTDCIIMGNGSGSYSLTGDIIIIPNFSSLIDSPNQSRYDLLSANALVIHCNCDLGTKFNLVWGDDNDNIAYLITAKYGGSNFGNGDLETIRKIVLRKGKDQGSYGIIVENSTPFNGTFDIIETYKQKTAGYPDCVQGACFFKGELYACIGHDYAQYWKMKLTNGQVYRKCYKQNTYYTGKVKNFGTASGVCINKGMMYIGRYGIGVMAIRL